MDSLTDRLEHKLHRFTEVSPSTGCTSSDTHCVGLTNVVVDVVDSVAFGGPTLLWYIQSHTVNSVVDVILGDLPYVWFWFTPNQKGQIEPR